MSKKETDNAILAIGAVVLVVSLIFLCFTFYDGVASFQTPIDIFDESYNINNIAETDRVESDIKVLLGQYYQIDFRGTGAYDYFYILPVVREKGTYYMGLQIAGDKRAEYDKMSEDTLAYLHGAITASQLPTLSIKGRIVKMSERNKAAFDRWFDGQDYDESGYDRDMLLGYYISDGSDNSALATFWVMLSGVVVGTFMIVIGLRLIQKNKKAKREQTCVVIKGVSYPKAMFARTDSFLRNDETVFAIQEISNITGLDLQEAQQVAANWSSFYL